MTEWAYRANGRKREEPAGAEALLERITHDVGVMSSRACIRGMRVTVGTILGLLAAGRIEQEILAEYPYLEQADLRAALTYAAWRLQEWEIPLETAVLPLQRSEPLKSP